MNLCKLTIIINAPRMTIFHLFFYGKFILNSIFPAFWFLFPLKRFNFAPSKMRKPLFTYHSLLPVATPP